MNHIARQSFVATALLLLACLRQNTSHADGLNVLRNDVLCAVVGIKASKSQNPNVRIAGMVTALFYLGRVDADAPDGSGNTMIADELSKITDAALHSEARRCGNALSQKGQWLESIGEAFSHTK